MAVANRAVYWARCDRTARPVNGGRSASAMPKVPDPTSITHARHATLPRRAGLVMTGRKRPLGIAIREGNQTIQPQIALWLDAESGFVFATQIINPLES